MYVAWFKENIANKHSDSQQVMTSGPEHTPFSPPTPQMSYLLGPSICYKDSELENHMSKVTLIWWLKDFIKFLPHLSSSMQSVQSESWGLFPLPLILN